MTVSLVEQIACVRRAVEFRKANVLCLRGISGPTSLLAAQRECNLMQAVLDTLTALKRHEDERAALPAISRREGNDMRQFICWCIGHRWTVWGRGGSGDAVYYCKRCEMVGTP